jgi:CubicO group peptidase (beta-lactamase class C family)
MLFGEGHQDLIAFILREKKDVDPGTRFQYSTGEATLLSEVVRQAGLKHGFNNDWFWDKFFSVVGMSSVVFQGDVKGAPAGGAFVFATPRDYARFGYLYLNDGCWEGQRLLPDGWVKSSSTMSDTFKNGAPDTETTPNGWMWWTNDVPPKTMKQPWPDAPADLYSAIGHWGQYVAVVPSLDTVIVRTGDDRDDKALDENKFFSLAVEVAK